MAKTVEQGITRRDFLVRSTAIAGGAFLSIGVGPSLVPGKAEAAAATASVVGLPSDSSRPFGKRISAAEARVSPSRARNASTMMSVPAGSEFLFQPRRSRALGAPPSTRQVVPSDTRKWIHEWGLTHSNFTTLPSSRIGLLRSNSVANEWCATAAPAAPTASTAPIAAAVHFLICMVWYSSVSKCGSFFQLLGRGGAFLKKVPV